MSTLENPEQLVKLYKQITSADLTSRQLAISLIQSNDELSIYFDDKKIIKLISKFCHYNQNIELFADKRPPKVIGSLPYYVGENNQIIEYPQKYKGVTWKLKHVPSKQYTEVGILWIYKNRHISKIINSKLFRIKHDMPRVKKLFDQKNKIKQKPKEKEKSLNTKCMLFY